MKISEIEEEACEVKPDQLFTRFDPVNCVLCEVKPDQLFTRFDPVNCVLLKPRLYFANPLLLIH